MTEQNEKDKPQEPEKKDGAQEKLPEDTLELDSDDEMEDLVDSIAEKERTMKGEK